jgi:hypothetical protein
MWFFIVYVSIGLFIMMEGLVLTWRISEHPKAVKAIACVISVLIWPLAFFLD